jgi:hypothetical protein
VVSLAGRKLQAAEPKLTRPYQSPRYPSHSLRRGCGAADVALRARAPGAAALSVLRRKTDGRCPCDPFLAVLRQRRRRRGGLTPAYLVTRVHVESSPEAMIPAAIFHVVAVLSGHGQSGGAGLAHCRREIGEGCTERGQAVHSPIRCHRDHWSERRSLSSLRGRRGPVVGGLAGSEGAAGILLQILGL